jgi:hypothetical protein
LPSGSQPKRSITPGCMNYRLCLLEILSGRAASGCIAIPLVAVPGCANSDP